MTRLTIIYVYFNTPKEIITSINSLEINKAENIEIIIIDNASSKKIPRELISDSKIRVIKNKKNIGFGPALNQGAILANGKYLLFLNPDTIVQPKFISKLLKRIEKDQKIGLLGVRYIDGEGQNIKSVGGFPTSKSIFYSFSPFSKIIPNHPSSVSYWMSNFNYAKEQQVPVIGGACMLIRSNIFKKIGGFDEQFFMYFEEADLSERVRRAGYKVLYYPDITITHLVGRSSQTNTKIKKIFESSRYKILKKYEGLTKAVIVESFVRYLTGTNMLLFAIFTLSLFLNLYRLDTLMMFYGDFGRDYLAARDMLLTGQIPLRGIPSSVVWLHQGPISIYFIALALFIGKFSPIAPAIFYGFLGAITSVLTYFLGRDYFNKHVGILSALFFATSPLVLINIRQPYHTSPIPFFTAIFFILLLKIMNGKINYLPILFFIYGLLFLLELSNSLIILVPLIAWIIYRPVIKRSRILLSVGGLALGVLPFIFYDLKNNFVQLGGFILWVINRSRLFLGVASEKANITEAGNAFTSLMDEIVRYIFPHSILVVIILAILFFYTLFKLKKEIVIKKEFIIILLWLVVPLVGFLVHAKPGTAYTPILFSCIAILLGFTFSSLIRINKIFIITFLTIISVNTLLVLKNNYYVTTLNSINRPELFNYSYGLDLKLRKMASDAIVKDAKEDSFTIEGGGYLRDITTSVDNYEYIVWYKGGKVDKSAKIKYRIYENITEVKEKNKIIFINKYIAVTRNEK